MFYVFNPDICEFESERGVELRRPGVTLHNIRDFRAGFLDVNSGAWKFRDALEKDAASSDQPRVALIVLESFEAMVGDIEGALENEDFKEKWAQGDVSFFLWDGHNEERDVESKESRLAKVLNSGEACGEKGACWHVMDKEVARWVETCKDQWKIREKRYNFLENIVQSEWKQLWRTNCIQFVLCTPSTAILFLSPTTFRLLNQMNRKKRVRPTNLSARLRLCQST
jgi:hypothetical protein